MTHLFRTVCFSCKTDTAQEENHTLAEARGPRAGPSCRRRVKQLQDLGGSLHFQTAEEETPASQNTSGYTFPFISNSP